MRLFRVLPWVPDAALGTPGHPLYVPREQGATRIGNPRHYAVLYASDDPAGAVGEAFRNRLPWKESLLVSPRHRGVRRTLVEFDADVALADLDDPTALVERRLRPSTVASPDRDTTQRWALAMFEEGRFDGIRWWSVRDSRWGSIGIWNHQRLVVRNVTPLTLSHPAVRLAQEMLGRRFTR